MDAYLENGAFLNFVSSVWKSHTALASILDVSFEKAEYKELSYQQKVQLVYGYHLAAQFKSVVHLEAAIAKWSNTRIFQHAVGCQGFGDGKDGVAVFQEPL